ncbi:hypothetical protein, partial [Paraburkholderia unamae]
CVRHAASVQSEPGSNSSVQYLLLFSVSLETGRSLKADRFQNKSKNLTYFSVRLLILLLLPVIPENDRVATASSAHTYRL